MMGKMLAGTKESPGEISYRNNVRVKEYRGMGSIGAMQDSRAARERYSQGQATSNKFVPEGVEGVVPYNDEEVGDVLFQLMGGLRSSMGYSGAATIEEFHEKAEFNRITPGGLAQAHPHDMIITKQAPNYRG
jgi:IMP dehydrogenase